MCGRGVVPAVLGIMFSGVLPFSMGCGRVESTASEDSPTPPHEPPSAAPSAPSGPLRPAREAAQVEVDQRAERALMAAGLTEANVQRLAAAVQQEASFAIAVEAAECRKLPSGEYEAAILTLRTMTQECLASLGGNAMPAERARCSTERVPPGTFVRATFSRDLGAIRLISTPLPRAFERTERSHSRVENAVVGFVDVEHDGPTEAWIALLESMQHEEACCETVDREARERTIDSVVARALIIAPSGAILGENVLVEGTSGGARERAHTVFGLPYDVESPRPEWLSLMFLCSPDDGFPSCHDDVRRFSWRLSPRASRSVHTEPER